MAKKQEWRRLLHAVADEIDRRGWIKGALVNSDGEVCALGGFRRVQAPSQVKVEAKQKLVRYLAERGRIDRRSYTTAPDAIMGWNDTHAVRGEVQRAMRDCANTFECPDHEREKKT